MKTNFTGPLVSAVTFVCFTLTVTHIGPNCLHLPSRFRFLNQAPRHQLFYSLQAWLPSYRRPHGHSIAQQSQPPWSYTNHSRSNIPRFRLPSPCPLRSRATSVCRRLTVQARRNRHRNARSKGRSWRLGVFQPLTTARRSFSSRHCTGGWVILCIGSFLRSPSGLPQESTGLRTKRSILSTYDGHT